MYGFRGEGFLRRRQALRPLQVRAVEAAVRKIGGHGSRKKPVKKLTSPFRTACPMDIRLPGRFSKPLVRFE